ncbi:transporter substrate-binding domain-containing protein [Synechococcus sp. UW179A]|uniref:transporter substrate-binding domain-containing protein n=1 Tax=Synechococcus sp. UW179A TaxID=2575510 RepID=UPI00352F301D
MKRVIRVPRISLLLAGLISVAVPGMAVAEPLRVGVSGAPPFVMPKGEPVQGISTQVWEEVANRLNQPYEVFYLPNTEANLKAVENGDVDLAVGPISITPDRLANPRIDFTQPYFQGMEGLMIPVKPPGLWARFKPFFGWAALSSLGGLMILLFVVGNLIWLAERRRNTEHFPRQYLHGVGNGMWFALVTLTTVGYGDRSPTTRTGRIIAGIWMLMSLLALSSITAGLASAFTVSLSKLEPSAIQDRSDLRGKTVSVVAGTTSGTWAKIYGARARESASLEKAIDLLLKGEVAAVLFDEAPLRYYLQQKPEAPFKMAPFALASQTYGFVVPMNSVLRTPIDVELLQMQRSGEVKSITDRLLQ